MKKDSAPKTWTLHWMPSIGHGYGRLGSFTSHQGSCFCNRLAPVEHSEPMRSHVAAPTEKQFFFLRNLNVLMLCQALTPLLFPSSFEIGANCFCSFILVGDFAIVSLFAVPMPTEWLNLHCIFNGRRVGESCWLRWSNVIGWEWWRSLDHHTVAVRGDMQSLSARIAAGMRARFLGQRWNWLGSCLCNPIAHAYDVMRTHCVNYRRWLTSVAQIDLDST